MSNLSLIYYPINKGDICYTYDLSKVLHYTFPHTPSYVQGIIAKDCGPDTVHKEYVRISDFSQFVSSELYKDVHMYEVIPIDKPVIPYFDVEWDAEQLNEKETLAYIISAISYCLEQNDVSINGISVYCASGMCGKSTIPSGRKASYHILYDTDKVFHNTRHHKDFFEKKLMPYIRIMITEGKCISFNWTSTKGDTKFAIDHEVYKSKQFYRLPYQSKWVFESKKTRKLLPYELIPAYYPDTGIQYVGIYEDYDNIEFISYSGEIIEPYNPHIDIIEGKFNIGYNSYTTNDFQLLKSLTDILDIKYIDGFSECCRLI